MNLNELFIQKELILIKKHLCDGRKFDCQTLQDLRFRISLSNNPNQLSIDCMKTVAYRMILPIHVKLIIHLRRGSIQ